eukprot:2999344-Alexandrium_andersonii.AAC.1
MSASLVGSEMCIRDRSACGVPDGNLGVWVVGSMSGSSGTHGCPDAMREACLLYTSDAADDM